MKGGGPGGGRRGLESNEEGLGLKTARLKERGMWRSITQASWQPPPAPLASDRHHASGHRDIQALTHVTRTQLHPRDLFSYVAVADVDALLPPAAAVTRHRSSTASPPIRTSTPDAALPQTADIAPAPRQRRLSLRQHRPTGAAASSTLEKAEA